MKPSSYGSYGPSPHSNLSNLQQTNQQAKAYQAFNNAISTSQNSHSNLGQQSQNQSQNQATSSFQSKLLGTLNGVGLQPKESPILSSQGGLGSSDTTNSVTGQTTLQHQPASSANPSSFTPTPPSHSSQHQQADPWSALNSSASHLPSSITNSINNPGLPSGVIVSSAAVNGMAMNGAQGLGQGTTRPETPVNQLPGSSNLGAGLPGQGGKLLLSGNGNGNGAGGVGNGMGSGIGSLPLVTSSLVQPGSVPTPGNGNGNGNGNGMGLGGGLGGMGMGSALGLPGGGGGGVGTPGHIHTENEKVYYLIVDLMSPNTREGALLELSKKREQWDDLALVLWHSFGELKKNLFPFPQSTW